ncbi:MAG: hypothetical protein KBS41_05055 [Oscillospiraceae bacterium]|nr:hypothetical protein [Candidatus Equicaccousia limihippi]
MLADVMAPSDIIVFEQNREFYVLASILKGSPSSAQNYLYRLDTQNLTLELCTKQEDFGEGGFRNAGLLFEDNGRLVRPGQNCPQNSYGKSLYFWEPIKIDSEKYEESFITELTRNDITVNGTFDGIHTYNKLMILM